MVQAPEGHHVRFPAVNTEVLLILIVWHILVADLRALLEHPCCRTGVTPVYCRIFSAVGCMGRAEFFASARAICGTILACAGGRRTICRVFLSGINKNRNDSRCTERGISNRCVRAFCERTLQNAPDHGIANRCVRAFVEEIAKCTRTRHRQPFVCWYIAERMLNTTGSIFAVFFFFCTQKGAPPGSGA